MGQRFVHNIQRDSKKPLFEFVGTDKEKDTTDLQKQLNDSHTAFYIATGLFVVSFILNMILILK